jgi:Tol biopolymer transport system component
MGREQGLRLRLASVSVDGGIGKELPLATNQDGDTIRTIPRQGGNRVSPDGKMFISSAWTSKDKNPINPYFPYLKIWKLAVDGSEQIQLTKKAGNYADLCPSWSPNGEKVAFVRGRTTKGDFLNYDEAGIYIIDSSGKETEILASSSDKFIFSIAWSPDGKMIAYFTKEKESPNVCYMNVIYLETGTNKVVREFPPTVNEHIELAWSPDSRQIALNGEKIHVVNIDNGSIENIETNLLDVIIFHIDWSPDGNNFVFGGLIMPKSEFWFMENFLPEFKAEQ